MAAKLSSRVSTSVACSSCRFLAVPSAITQRSFSTSTRLASEEPPTRSPERQPPRWSHTPPTAKAPFSLHIGSKRPDFYVNSDPKLLDQFYVRMLGEGGHKLLSEETKWLAVTHKSFDQGRRGFNDRLAYLGKRIVQLQTSLALVQDGSTVITQNAAVPDTFNRTPFTHPALDGLNNLDADAKAYQTSKEKLAALGMKYGLQKVMRWAPRKPYQLQASGIDLVLAHTLYSIVGAIALEQGGQMANKVAREKILAPLGVRIVA
ncbi:hypothetical protein ASPZODRAFT_130470 [Penicilliopsis zonata CBS 506.65]|uniref:RNase III domain-containing protein n=1 Tax=Penicilliopsis zonata CBS 506.65 TaxID=1073090 RepID=A0A1L9SN18_9EURO|nr:hypothetical protein ASPZODRAFT_130470 [Penicilliopsis zonata CBS 506.65]OJJ48444.1 hypothetical protein ASPZODRAFT_130470 [Penicilliopsis zonata CBS 506.65]